MRACIFCPSSLKILFLSEINHILHTTHLTRGQLEASMDGMTQQRRKSRRPKKTAMISILEAAQRFGDPNVAGARLLDQRWPDSVRCPRCGADNPSTVTRKHSPLTWYVCRNRIPRAQEGGCGGYNFSVKTDSVMHDSKLSPEKW